MKRPTFLLLSLLCSAAISAETVKDISFTEVIFQETESGLEPYLSRLLVNGDFMRLDDGINDGDFILFDRAKKTIISINYEDQNMLEIKRSTQNKIDFKLKFEVRTQALADAPMIGGKQPRQHQLLADDKLCQSVINVQGLLPDVQQALIEY